jgi:predicted dehydrogenase
MSELRIIVVGYGLIGRQRAAALANIDGAVLVAIVDPGFDGASDMSGVPHYQTLGEIQPDDFDAAVIAVPHDLAAGLASAVLQSGRPVLVEKPLGPTAAEARKLEQLASRVSRPSFVGYNYRFLPAVSELAQAVASGSLGTLRNLDLLVGHGGHPDSAEGWKLDPERAGGGVLLDPGVHLLDLLTCLSPEARCTAITATRGFWRTGVEEDLVAIFRADRMIATVRVSHVRWINTFRIEAFGEDGYAIADGRGGNYGAMTLRIGRRWAWARPGVAGQRESEALFDYGTDNQSLAMELQSVVDVWRSAAQRTAIPRPATMAEARAVAELCEQLYEQMT